MCANAARPPVRRLMQGGAGVTARNYWIGVVSRSHARLGVEGGFIQLNHGR